MFILPPSKLALQDKCLENPRTGKLEMPRPRPEFLGTFSGRLRLPYSNPITSNRQE